MPTLNLYPLSGSGTFSAARQLAGVRSGLSVVNNRTLTLRVTNFLLPVLFKLKGCGVFVFNSYHTNGSFLCFFFKPLYGLLQAKLQLITHAYFEEKDFSQISILKVNLYPSADVFG